MIGHVKLCLDEIEAEIDAADFSLVGARARELLAQHIAGIRDIVETIDGAAMRGGASCISHIAAASNASAVAPVVAGLPTAA